MDPLFKLQEYERAFSRFFHTAVNELMGQRDPLLQMIPREPADTIPSMRNTMPSGEVLDREPIQIEAKITSTADEIIAGNPETMACVISDTADSGLESLMPQIFKHLGQVCQAAGTSTDAGGQPLSHELILKCLESIELDFDKNGNPMWPTLVMGPQMAEALRRLPPVTPEQETAWQEMINRKRDIFNARRRNRQLS